MKKSQCLEILLPEKLADLPVRIIRSPNQEQLVVSIPDKDVSYADRIEKKYVFIWRRDDYTKVSTDEILWIEAAKSYSDIHLCGDRTLTISFNLAVVERELPGDDFMRIHRSCIVNLRHVVSLMGNSLKIGDRRLTIGREYRPRLLDRFIFLGVRRAKFK